MNNNEMLRKIKKSESDIVELNEQLDINTNDITTLKKDIGTTANIEELKTVNNEATQKILELDEKLTQVGDISETIVNVENSKIDYFGEEHLTVDERLNEDFDKLWQFNNESQLLEYSGTNITTNNTYYGLTKDLSIKGRTLQNLITSKYAQPGGDSCVRYLSYQSTKQCTVVYSGNFTLSLSIKSTSNIWLKNVPLTFVNNKASYTPLTGEVIDAIHAVITIDNTTSKFLTEKILVLEGDYTSTPLSELLYIEGIKSTGETDVVDGKHKVSAKSFGKNLFDIHNSVWEGFKNTYELLDNTITISNSVSCAWSELRTILHLKDNTNYTIECNIDVLSGPGGRFGIFDLNSNSWLNYRNETDNFTFNSGINRNLCLRLYSTREISGIGKVKYSNIQIEESTTPTDYEPYKESTIEYLLDEPLRSLPNGTCDEIVGNKLIKRVGKVILNGSETWNALDSFDSSYKYLELGADNIPFKVKNSYVFNDHICNTLPVANSYTVPVSVWLFYNLSTQRKSLRIAPFNRIAEKDEIVSWLKTNPTTVYYELATPIITELDQTLILNTFDGTTHITSDNYLLPTITAKIPSNVQAVVTNLMEENKELNNQVSTLNIENEDLKEGHIVHDIKIADSEEAINFLLMGSFSMMNLLDTQNLERGGSSMPSYLAKQIYQGRLDYEQVVTKYPQFKEDIDILLKAYVENDGIIYNA